jgi:hypothetical protein
MSLISLCHNLYSILYDMLDGKDGLALAMTSAQAYRTFMMHMRGRAMFDKYFMVATSAAAMRLCLSCKHLEDLSMRTLLAHICERVIEYADIVALLLPLTKNPPNYLFTFAAQRGHTGIICLLLADVRLNPADDDNMAIRHAVLRNKLDAVQVLMTDKRVDPSARNNWSLWYAWQSDYKAIARILLTDLRVSNLDRTMRKR